MEGRGWLRMGGDSPSHLLYISLSHVSMLKKSESGRNGNLLFANMPSGDQKHCPFYPAQTLREGICSPPGDRTQSLPAQHQLPAAAIACSGRGSTHRAGLRIPSPHHHHPPPTPPGGRSAPGQLTNHPGVPPTALLQTRLALDYSNSLFSP